MTSATQSTTSHTSKPSNEAPPPQHLNTSKTLPIHPTSTSTSANPIPLEVSIPDGRRNSLGEALHSPIETWKPNLLVRNQSWNHQDLKRLHVEEVLKKEEWRNDVGAMGVAYSHGGGEEGKK
ncbi:hypothetical protein SBOR_6259 [Sclerotinia borealis F-4128]|uniref:Uncharacterized protein n=1 Tax=Sclerotinia borealis (strain F-4128) TaxID=1432307 RepID=W9C9E3_SCLBF|nr:hypothetical protein SBOR_6259 [Sclerotinia borealis F-4128]